VDDSIVTAGFVEKQHIFKMKRGFAIGPAVGSLWSYGYKDAPAQAQHVGNKKD
jgi:hypothetical protein